MASIRNIKRRIRSVKSTQQITKAMNLVAASKLQRAKQAMERTRPYFYETQKVISAIVKNSKGVKHPFLERREVRNIALIVLTGDRGLCGGYNTNVSKEAIKLAARPGDKFIFVGGKGRDYFRRRGKAHYKLYTGISEKPQYSDAAEIGQEVAALFKGREVDEVYIAYTEFKSTISHTPKVVRLLPVELSSVAAAAAPGGSLMNYEPSEEEVLDYVIPMYINTVIYGAMAEAAACEQGARMTSMDSATENADEMIDTLTLKFNQARQSAITQEITEIVSGANALK